jgi:hypothetical protein
VVKQVSLKFWFQLNDDPGMGPSLAEHQCSVDERVSVDVSLWESVGQLIKPARSEKNIPIGTGPICIRAHSEA